jgi:hypothetical protein
LRSGASASALPFCGGCRIAGTIPGNRTARPTFGRAARVQLLLDDWPLPFIVPLVEPLLIESPPEEFAAPIEPPLIEDPLPVEPSVAVADPDIPPPIVPLVEPSLIEPVGLPDMLAVPLELSVFWVLDPAAPGTDIAGVLGLAMVADAPAPPLPAVCAKARPEVQSENASVAAISLRDMVIS